MILRSLPALAALSFTGCVIDGAGPPRHEFRSIDRDTIKHLKVDLQMGAGDLQASSGTEKLMAADFTYSILAEKPYVRYSSTDGEGTLEVREPGKEHTRGIGSHKYEWDIRLSRDIPTELSVHCGAGSAQLDLGGLNLDNVDVEMGVGQLKLDLRGVPKHDYSVRIQGGVGEATVRLGADTGVVAQVQGGIGSVHASGLTRHGNRYENEAFGKSKTTIHLDIQGGIGSVRLITD